MSGEIIVADRSLEQVTNGIRMLSNQVVVHYCQIGKLLVEAKAMVGHGGWGEYLQNELGYKTSTANNLMRLFNEYGEFGPNPQTFGSLSQSKAVALLQLPAEEREAFAQEHDVADMSVRDLNAAIAAEKARADEAVCDAAALREQLAAATEEIGAAHQKAEDWQKQASDWRSKAAEAKEDGRKLRADIVALENDLAVANANAGKVDPAELSKIRDEARSEAQRIVEESHSRELSGKDDRIQELERQLRDAEAALGRADEMRDVKDLIKAEVKSLGEALNRLNGYYIKFKSNPELGPVIRQVAVRQIENIQRAFEIEPV